MLAESEVMLARSLLVTASSHALPTVGAPCGVSDTPGRSVCSACTVK